MGEPHLEVDFRHRIGSLAMDVRFQTSAPWTVLFGPSGSGKSTILRVVAGLERAKQGKIVVRGQLVADPQAGVWVAGHRRPMRWVGQRAYLSPRKRVNLQMIEGVRPGDRLLTGEDGMDRSDQLLERFALDGLDHKLPEELSGGQRQMVSVVKAAVGARGRILLLDEPFAGLDAKVRDELIVNLRSWLGNTPVVSVTHDVGEAFLLGAEVVRIAEGRVVAQGPVREVLAEERKRLSAILR